jgi:hypothetical protein
VSGYAPAFRLGWQSRATTTGGGGGRRVRLPAAGVAQDTPGGPQGIAGAQCTPAGAAFPPSCRGGGASTAYSRDILWAQCGRHDGLGRSPGTAGFSVCGQPAATRSPGGGGSVALPALLQFVLRPGGHYRCGNAPERRGSRVGGLPCRWPDTGDRPGAATLAALRANRRPRADSCRGAAGSGRGGQGHGPLGHVPTLDDDLLGSAAEASRGAGLTDCSGNCNRLLGSNRVLRPTGLALSIDIWRYGNELNTCCCCRLAT